MPAQAQGGGQFSWTPVASTSAWKSSLRRPAPRSPLSSWPRDLHLPHWRGAPLQRDTTTPMTCKGNDQEDRHEDEVKTCGQLYEQPGRCESEPKSDPCLRPGKQEHHHRSSSSAGMSYAYSQDQASARRQTLTTDPHVRRRKQRQYRPNHKPLRFSQQGHCQSS